MFVTSEEGATDFPKTVLNVYKNTDSLEPEEHNAFWLPIDLSNIFSSRYGLSNFISYVLVIKISLQILKGVIQSYVTNLSFSAKVFLLLHGISGMAWDRYVITCSYGLWLAVAITGCALGVCLAITNFNKKSNQRLSLFDTLFYIPSCICQQGQKANYL